MRARPRLARACSGDRSTSAINGFTVRLKTANGPWPWGIAATLPQRAGSEQPVALDADEEPVPVVAVGAGHPAGPADADEGSHLGGAAIGKPVGGRVASGVAGADHTGPARRADLEALAE